MKKDEGIIPSLLWVDKYKFTMGQFAWFYQPGAVVSYGFTNRSLNIPLGRLIDEGRFREELDHVRSLTFRMRELAYLKRQGTYLPGYINYLSTFKLPPYDLKYEGEQFSLKVTGTWPETIFWETLILTIQMSLYCESVLKRDGLDLRAVWREGERRLLNKTSLLSSYTSVVRLIDFICRRPFSVPWHKNVLEILMQEIPNILVGTSNVYLAWKNDIPALGTMAHEVFMIYAALFGRDSDVFLCESVYLALRDWENLYPNEKLIALTDTFGTYSFLEGMPREMVERLDGYRHDSMQTPEDYGYLVANFLRSHGIDPKTKSIVFSDGLDVPSAIKLSETFSKIYAVVYSGIGGNLGNDMGLPKPSTVVKPISANGRPAIKLSDVSGKHMGDTTEQLRYERAFLAHKKTY